MEPTEIAFGAIALGAIYVIVTSIEAGAKKISQAINSITQSKPENHREIVDELSQIREQLERICRKMRGEPDPPTLGELLGEALRAKPNSPAPESSDETDQAKS